MIILVICSITIITVTIIGITSIITVKPQPVVLFICSLNFQPRVLLSLLPFFFFFSFPGATCSSLLQGYANNSFPPETAQLLASIKTAILLGTYWLIAVSDSETCHKVLQCCTFKCQHTSTCVPMEGTFITDSF